MNCAEFEDLVEALGRGDPTEEGVRQSALSHAEACAACNRQLAESRALTNILRSIALRNREAAASPGLEVWLMEAFDNRVRTGASFWRRNWAPVGAAASLLIIFGVTLTMLLVPRPVPTAKGNRPTAVVPAREAAMEDAAEIATEFFALQGDLDLPGQESSGIVRVTLPRTTLLAFGLPMNEERVFEPLQAEILVGEDGAARAIRFLDKRP